MHNSKVHSNEIACRKVDILGWNSQLWCVIIITTPPNSSVEVQYVTENVNPAH